MAEPLVNGVGWMLLAWLITAVAVVAIEFLEREGFWLWLNRWR